MTAQKNSAGAWVVSGIVAGYLVTRTYYYYNKREAIALFKREARGDD
jgi:hypothetical protein